MAGFGGRIKIFGCQAERIRTVFYGKVKTKQIFSGKGVFFAGGSLNTSRLLQKTFTDILKRPVSMIEANGVLSKMQEKIREQLNTGIIVHIPVTKKHLWITTYGQAGVGRILIINLTAIAKNESNAYDQITRYSGLMFSDNDAHFNIKGNVLKIYNGYGEGIEKDLATHIIDLTKY